MAETVSEMAVAVLAAVRDLPAAAAGQGVRRRLVEVLPLTVCGPERTILAFAILKPR
jgi:hypothetical protein